MRNFAIAISITALLFTAFLSSFAQQTGSDLFLEVSNKTINPGGAVSARISTIMEPNATKDVMVRFLPPPGSEEPVQSGKLHLQADSVGFANGTVWYPNALQNTTSVQQLGNYTVLVQDMQTGMLLQRAAFEVVESKLSATGFFNFFLENEAFLSSLILAAAGALFAYLYNRRAANRQTKVNLNQKKTEMFLQLRPHYKTIAESLKGLVDISKHIQYPKPGESKERAVEIFFYNLVIYARELKIIGDKPGAWFLSNLEHEFLLNAVFANINERPNAVLGTTAFYYQLPYVLSEKETFDDLQKRLKPEGNDETTLILFGAVKKWLTEDLIFRDNLGEFFYDMELFIHLLSYEDISLVKDWYTDNKEGNKRLDELKNTINTQFKQDKRYSNSKYELD